MTPEKYVDFVEGKRISGLDGNNTICFFDEAHDILNNYRGSYKQIMAKFDAQMVFLTATLN